jgi:hypothetical protein
MGRAGALKGFKVFAVSLTIHQLLSVKLIVNSLHSYHMKESARVLKDQQEEDTTRLWCCNLAEESGVSSLSRT